MTEMFHAMASAALAGRPATEQEALAVLRSPDEKILDVVAAASRLRRRYFADTVKVNYLVNLRSGLCPEDCGYCSQRLGSQADVLTYSWLSPEDALEQAGHGLAGGARRICMVASGRGPSNRDVDRVATMARAIKDEDPAVEVCACLGLLKDGQAARLREAGVDAYNHNINTARSHHDEIVTTHTYDDRVDTLEQAKGAGLSPCSGLIAGLGESDEQLIEALSALRELGSDSIPINFLMPFDGTPLEAGAADLTPLRCLRIMAAARFMCPQTEIRIAAGREMHLRSAQGLALHVANSIFLGDYLTAEGQAARDDLELIRDQGFVVLGADEPPMPADRQAVTTAARRRGAGTDLPANA
ncbi:biotin synthase BioB [Aeromicrobium sp. CTD01-1L150]|uniref:biotin synthase BioB n=1 Tax=Aeromicrobium sp. CTD01-1L150 TaxID=3341830 RepID=UPI0035C08B50